ncbi:MAG: hypothetical protein EBU46_18310 [Nitrosomonadaceae bacterium]|nr:hypothetical protein [Nitrosomonadaceae bacterium]
MLVPVRCMTCGCPVGDVAPVFARLRTRRAREVLGERGALPTQAMIDAELSVPCGDILDRLKVTADCCRKTLMTSMVFSDYY